MKYLKYILWTLVIFTAGVIFTFSSQSAKESKSVSDGITRKIVDTLPMTKNKPEAEKVKIVEKLNHYIRKCAHFTLFFLFGMFLICAMLCTYYNRFSTLKIVIVSMIIAFLYAVFDEVHQMFVPNRGPGIKDVFIDFSGSLSAFALVYYIKYLILKRNLKFN